MWDRQRPAQVPVPLLQFHSASTGIVTRTIIRHVNGDVVYRSLAARHPTNSKEEQPEGWKVRPDQLDRCRGRRVEMDAPKNLMSRTRPIRRRNHSAVSWGNKLNARRQLSTDRPQFKNLTFKLALPIQCGIELAPSGRELREPGTPSTGMSEAGQTLPRTRLRRHSMVRHTLIVDQ